MTDRRMFLAGMLGLVGCANYPTAPGLNVPWGLAFLEDGRGIVGQLDHCIISVIDPKAPEDKRISELGSVPGVFAEHNASRGLLGLAFEFGDDSTLYAFYTAATDQRVARIEG